MKKPQLLSMIFDCIDDASASGGNLFGCVHTSPLPLLHFFQTMRYAQNVCFVRHPFFKLSAFIFNKDAIINFASVCFRVECFFFPLGRSVENVSLASLTLI